MGEHLLCKQGVVGSIPSASTSALCAGACVLGACWGLAGVRSVRIGKDEFGHGRAWDARRWPRFVLFDM